MIKIVRKRYNKLFEEGEQPAIPAAQPGQTATAAPAQAAPAPAPAALPAQTTTAAPVAQTTTPAPVQQPLQDPNAAKNGEAAQKIIQQMQQKPYWIMTVDLPTEIQKAIPDFKQGNAQADPAIKAWGAFKLNPDENTYNAFIQAFTQYASGGQQEQPAAQPAQTTTPAPAQGPNEGVKAAYNFSKALHENLNTAYKKNYYKNVMIDYFDKI